MLRVLIVDDERLARQKIRTFLDARDDVAVAGEAANVNEAIALVRSERPELLLLDIQMPGGDGFDVVRALPAGHTPAVVFITAHDDYALRAFEVAAVEQRLDGRHFVRIHRSTIVNLRRVSEIRDDTTVVLHDGTQLAMSRRFRSRVRYATGLDL